MAKFTNAMGYESEPAIKWWVKGALHQRNCIISCLKTVQYRKGWMEFYVEIPGMVEEAQKLDKEAGND